MSYANRGMGFEQLIEYSNLQYEQKGIAVINKRPTPVKILGRSSNGMIHGFLEKPSTVDYDGTYRGKSIVFEAKSTKELTRFPLSNIQQHQFDYLAKCHRHGAISFMLIEFERHQTVYLLPFETLKHYWDARKTGKRGSQSITVNDLDISAYQVEQGRVALDYLAVVDRLESAVKGA